jgi:hypothetical protein
MCYSDTNYRVMMTFLNNRKSTIGPLLKDGTDTHSTAGAQANLKMRSGEYVARMGRSS